MTQKTPYETLEEALTADLLHLGPRKAVALDVWPRKSAREAHNRLDACLNPERADKFDSCELIYLLQRAREVGSHEAMNYLCDHAGYSAPVPMKPEVSREHLLRDFMLRSAALQAELQRVSDALGINEKLPSSLRRVV